MRHFAFDTRCSSVACAIAVPSVVAVPRPSSSNTTSDFFDAAAKMEEHSDISSRNVDAPIAMLSLAPMRVCTPSMTVISALAAGTNDPHCAMTTMSAV